MDFDLKIQPRFIDDECAIIFSIYFSHASMKVGEAIIYTCEEINNNNPIDFRTPPSNDKIAYVTELTVTEDLKTQFLSKIQNFLRILGISKFIYNEDEIRKGTVL